MDTPNEDVDYIICGDTGWVEGSKSLTCALCGVEVFCSPSGQEIMAKQEVLPICIRCVDVGPGDEVAPVSEAQMDELKQHGITEDQIATALWYLQLPREERL